MATTSPLTPRQKAIHARDVAKWRVKHNLRLRLWAALSGPKGSKVRREVERAIDQAEGTLKRAASR